MHEIVTLQFGQRANYLATHFWNLQESYFTYTPNTSPSIIDHDIHFRPGIGTDNNETYTPRTIIYDLKGGFGTLRQRNSLYEDREDTSQPQIWSNASPATIKQPPITQITYQQNLDAGLPTSQLRSDQVRYWSDFNRVYFHPRSIVQINEYSLNSQLTPFESWDVGQELFRDVDRDADMLDRDVRPFVEECDSMQGFQVFSGTDDAWGGFTERYLDALKDEFGKKSIWGWGVEDRQATREAAVMRKANAAKSLAGIAKLVTGYTRLSVGNVPEYVKIGGSEWEKTALMAAAVESVTLSDRLRRGEGRGATMAQIESVLNTNDGQNVWNLGLSLVKENIKNGNGRVVLNGNSADEDDRERGIKFDIEFTPLSMVLSSQRRKGSEKRHIFGQVETTRAVERVLRGLPDKASMDREEAMRKRHNEEAIVEQFTVPLAFSHIDAFPARLFTPYDDHPPEEGLPLSAGLDTSSTVGNNILELRDLVTRQTRAIAVDEREELYNDLTEVADKYSFGWDSDDNSEDE